MARKQKKRAARWDKHGRAQKSSGRNRKRKKEKSDEAIQKSALERKEEEKAVKKSGEDEKLAKSKASGLKKRRYWTSAMAWLQQLVLLGQ